VVYCAVGLPWVHGLRSMIAKIGNTLLHPRLVAEDPRSSDECQHVDLKESKKSRRAWTSRVDLPKYFEEGPCRDGKFLTDYAEFLRDLRNSKQLKNVGNPCCTCVSFLISRGSPSAVTGSGGNGDDWSVSADTLVSLWKLSMARFTPASSFSNEFLDNCRALSLKLHRSWAKYRGDVDGYRSSEKGVIDWESRTKSCSINSKACLDDEESERLCLVDEHHNMYEVAMAAMTGIHVAVLCHTLFHDAIMTSVPGRRRSCTIYNDPIADGLWKQSFPGISLRKCVQDSVVTYEIPPDGTAYSPPLRELTGGKFCSAFIIEDFCPGLFARMRQLCAVSNERYFNSICQVDAHLRAFGSNSQSGAFFFLSHDKKFFLKTALRREAEALIRMMPSIVGRFEQVPETLIIPFLGLYRLKGEYFHKDCFFFVMMNSTQHHEQVHWSFDLKGSSSHGRYSTHGPGKDRNFEEDFHGLGLNSQVAHDLLKTHAEDVALLTEFGCMDYSVFLDVHDTHLGTGVLGGAEKTDVRLGMYPKAYDEETVFARKLTSSFRLEVPSDVRSRHARSHIAWRPNTGFRSADGRFLYTMALIDLLVPFRAPLLEQGFANLLAKGVPHDKLAIVSPEAYGSRQKDMMNEICRRHYKPCQGTHIV